MGADKMQHELAELYRNARAPRFSPYNERRAFHTPASRALIYARQGLEARKARQSWDALEGYVCANYEAPRDPKDGHAWGQGPVRIVSHPDEFCELDFLLGDTYEPRHNPEIKPEILERERREYIEKIERDGVWGYVAEVWNGAEWEHADSIWGFVGDDFEESGYDTDLMRAAIDRYEELQREQARALEATRPDMYGLTA